MATYSLAVGDSKTITNEFAKNKLSVKLTVKLNDINYDTLKANVTLTMKVWRSGTLSASSTCWIRYKKTTASSWTKVGSDTYSIGGSGEGTKTIITKTVNVPYNSDGTLSFECEATWKIGSITYGGTTYSGEKTAGDGDKFKMPTAITAVGAPTNVTIKKNWITPNDSLEVTWEGATAGTNNNIAGYRIYYKSSTTETAPTGSDYSGYVDVGATEKNYSLTFSGLARGNYVTIGVSTKGAKTVSSTQYSNIKTSGSSARVNKLPSLTVSSSKSVVSSTGGQVTFTLSGTDTDTSQTLSYWYSNSSTGSKTQINASKEFAVNSNNKNFYFWAYDGCEYSPYTLKTISINEKPKISQLTLKAENTHQSQVEGYGTYVSYVSAEATTNKSKGKIKWSLKYANNKDFTNSNTLYLGETTVTSTLTKLEKFSVYQKLGANALGKYYTVTAVYNDDVEDSDTGVGAHLDSFKIPTAPTGIGVYNQYSNMDLDGTANRFFDKLRFYFYGDSAYKPIQIKYKEGETEKELSLGEWNSNSSGGYLNTFFNYSDFNSNKSYEFQVTLENIENFQSHTLKYNKTSLQRPEANYIYSCSLSQEKIKPFTKQGYSYLKGWEPIDAIDFTITNFLTSTSEYAPFGIKSINDLKFRISCGTLYYDVPISDKGSVTIDNNNITFSGVSLNNFYNLGSNLLGLDYNKNHNITIQSCYTNVFGVTFFLGSTTLELVFQEPSKIDFFKIYVNDKETQSEDKPKIQEGMTLNFSWRIGEYNAEKVSSYIEVAKSTGTETPTTGWQFLTNGEILEFNGHENFEPTYQTNNASFKIGKNSNTINWFFRLCVKDSNNNITQKDLGFYFNSIKHDYGLVEITSVGDISNSTEINYTISDWGYAGDVNVSKIGRYQIGEGQLVQFSQNVDKQGSFNIDLSQNKTYYLIKIEITTTITQIFNNRKIETSKTFSSNVFTKYNVAPTLAYRKNHVGINTNSFRDNDVFVVQQLDSTRKIIRFVSVDAANPKTITIDLSNGTISGATLSGATLDSTTIDGGTW